MVLPRACSLGAVLGVAVIGYQLLVAVLQFEFRRSYHADLYCMDAYLSCGWPLRLLRGSEALSVLAASGLVVALIRRDRAWLDRILAYDAIGLLGLGAATVLCLDAEILGLLCNLDKHRASTPADPYLVALETSRLRGWWIGIQPLGGPTYLAVLFLGSILALAFRRREASNAVARSPTIRFVSAPLR